MCHVRKLDKGQSYLSHREVTERERGKPDYSSPVLKSSMPSVAPVWATKRMHNGSCYFTSGYCVNCIFVRFMFLNIYDK